MKRVSGLLVALVMVIGLSGMVQTVSAEMVNVEVIGSWTTSDFTVTDAADPLYSTGPDFDGEVFGVAPSDGSTTFDLLVNTDSAVSFAAGYTYTDIYGTHTLTHDWFGYTDVSLVDPPHTFGTATWEDSGIVTGLQGPDSLTAALWTDIDITTGDPSQMWFRMFGTGDGLSADLYISFSSQFLLWEYYGGEEIRSASYSASVSAVPEPSTLLLLSSGLVGLGFVRRRFKR